ncbi:amylo-alpha-1,6-glucosidase [Carbonactinospora thermoautotrophica]|uniref:amylo-alpha-1,6-glucosidase n=1 Tax=Carbonactinospora thermoautotrophica TaxID=1469144 RepID=UPI00226FE6C5|nr:glycogen debranching N-terminal domain-containing protein [Carbonactinospora thermoautotrophica]
MTEAWAFGREPVRVGGGLVTLIEGSSFCISRPDGDIDPETAQGLFFRDTRILSTWQVRLEGLTLEPLTVIVNEPFCGSFLSRSVPEPGRADSTLLCQRERFVGAGMREDIILRNLGNQPFSGTLSVRVDADMADLFEVKQGRVLRRGEYNVEPGDGHLFFSRRWKGQQIGVRVVAEGGRAHGGNTLYFPFTVPPRGRWHVTLQVHPIFQGKEWPPAFPTGRPLEHAPVAQRFSRWQSAGPFIDGDDPALVSTLRQSHRDLGSLRIFDPEAPNLPVVAAGAPWFMALFGRDSLLTALMTVAVDQSLALGTLHMLARYQGRQVDPVTEEEPGRILHEVRLGVEAALALGGGHIYYGTVDATPLFVVLLGQLQRWGLPRDQIEALLPAADRALEWIERYGDRDGDGFVEYRRATEQGLVNQGWKDSWDGVNFADGTIAEPPIALCEVQGYVYQAYRARARLARWFDDHAAAVRWERKARELKKAFNERFWLPDRGWYAIGLDRDKRPIDALASNMGHCLWSGIVDADKARLVAERLLSPEMFNGYGVRTLATTMGAYNPMSYHNGAVWPHDNAIIAAGLMRYGFVEQAQRVACGILDAAAAYGGRLPELMCGFDREEFGEPVPYPTSCSPQAWAAATPIYLLQVLLRMEVDIPQRFIRINPALPRRFGSVRVAGISLNGSRAAIEVWPGHLRVTGLPEGVELISPLHTGDRQE